MLLLSTFLLGEDHGPIWRIFGICKHLRCEEVKCQYVANRHEKQDWDEALSLKTRRSPPTLSLLRFPRDGLARPAKPPHLPDHSTAVHTSALTRLPACRLRVRLRGHTQSLTTWVAALGRACVRTHLSGDFLSTCEVPGATAAAPHLSES